MDRMGKVYSWDRLYRFCYLYLFREVEMLYL